MQHCPLWRPLVAAAESTYKQNCLKQLITFKYSTTVCQPLLNLIRVLCRVAENGALLGYLDVTLKSLMIENIMISLKYCNWTF